MIFSMLSVSAMALDDTNGHWGQASIDRWAGYGALKGDNTGNFNPDNNMSRASVAQLADNTIAEYVASDNVTTSADKVSVTGESKVENVKVEGEGSAEIKTPGTVIENNGTGKVTDSKGNTVDEGESAKNPDNTPTPSVGGGSTSSEGYRSDLQHQHDFRQHKAQ